MINFINCLFLMDFYEPFEEMEANNVWFFSSRSNSYSTILRFSSIVNLFIFFNIYVRLTH